MTIRELIEELNLLNDDAVVKNVDLRDYGSDRGDYSCFYIGHGEGNAPTVGELRDFLYGIDGQTFTGYKGGDFLMTLDTPIRLGMYSCSGYDIEYDGRRWRSYIKTEWGDWLEVTVLSTGYGEPKKCPRCGGHTMRAKEKEGSLTCVECGFEITASSLEAAVSLWNAI